MPQKQKFYAVRVGRVPGVYLTLEDSMAQTKGYPFAAFKKFMNTEDAWAFVRQPTLTSPPSERSEHSTSSNTGSKLLEGDGDGESSVPASLKRELEQDDMDLNAIDIKSTSPVTSDYSSDRSSTITVSVKELDVVAEPRAKPNRKRRRIDPPPTSATPASVTPIALPQLDSGTKAFFTSLKYTNPTAFTKLAETGFGTHELLSMRGLPSAAISSRFRNLLGRNKPQLAAQIESLAFVVAHATEAAWTELERQGQLLCESETV